MPNLSNSSETESIVGIQFGVFSPDEITRRSVVEITTHSTQEGKIGGLADPRMGVLENGKLCRSCGLNFSDLTYGDEIDDDLEVDEAMTKNT